MGSGNSKDQAVSPPVASSTATTGDSSSSSSSSSQSLHQPSQLQQQQSATATKPQEEGEEQSKCPMHRSDGSYSWDLSKALFSKTFPHWAGGSKPLTKEQAQALSTPPPSTTKADEPTSGCPVKHQQEETSGCPVKHSSISSSRQQQRPEYNVYSQPLDPSNQMPSNPNQLPAPTQSSPLSTDRVASSIPKGGAAASGSTWTYPSPQMFYNALARKGKLTDDTAEEDIASVVALHNNMNEKTWAKVLQWEAAATASSDTDGANSAPPPPKLLKFQGRPTDLSPKAAFKHYVLGHPLPYDRHDWTVERADGTTTRYVIDYYHDESAAREDAASAHPALEDATASASLLVDVRPAVDDVRSVWNRCAMAMMPSRRGTSSSSQFEPLPLMPSATMKSQVAESVTVWQNIQAAAKEKQQQPTLAASVEEYQITDEQARELAHQFAQMLHDCRTAQAAVDRCGDDDSQAAARASLDLTLCLGQAVCPVQHDALVQRLHNNDDNDEAAVEEALRRVGDCVVHQTERHAAAKRQHPDLFK